MHTYTHAHPLSHQAILLSPVTVALCVFYRQEVQMWRSPLDFEEIYSGSSSNGNFLIVLLHVIALTKEENVLKLK